MCKACVPAAADLLPSAASNAQVLLPRSPHPPTLLQDPHHQGRGSATALVYSCCPHAHLPIPRARCCPRTLSGAGSTIKQGERHCVVYATGMQTFFGRAAALLGSANQVRGGGVGCTGAAARPARALMGTAGVHAPLQDSVHIVTANLFATTIDILSPINWRAIHHCFSSTNCRRPTCKRS